MLLLDPPAPSPTLRVQVTGLPLGWEWEGRPARHSEEEGEDAFLPATCQTPHGAAVPAQDTFPPAKPRLETRTQQGTGRLVTLPRTARLCRCSAALFRCRAIALGKGYAGTLGLLHCFCDGMQLETPRRSLPCSSLFKSFLAMQRGAPTLLARAAASPPGTYLSGPPRGAAMPGRGDGGEEASCHPIITRATGTETSAEPRQLERSHADISILYKRKG